MPSSREVAVAVAALLSVAATDLAAQASSPAALRRSNARGVRFGIGPSVAHVRPDGQPATVRPGVTMAAGWGFTDHLAVGTGVGAAYGVRMIGRSEPFGRGDFLSFRYTHARRSWRTLPIAEVALAESSFGNDDETRMGAWQAAWRVGLEHFFTLGTALELSVSPTSGTLDDRDPFVNNPATRSQRFRSVFVDARVTFRPWSRRRLD